MQLGFLLHWARQYRGRLLIISGLSLVSSATILVIPWLAGQLLGDVVSNIPIDPRGTLAMLVLALIALTAITIGVAIASEIASGRILAGLRAAIYEHVQSLPVGFHDQTGDGDMLALMTYEVSNLSNFLTGTLARLPSMLVTAIGAGGLLIALDPTLALVVPVLIPVFYIALKLIGRRLRGIAQKRRQAEVDVITQAGSDLDMLQAIKAFAIEDERRTKYRAALEHSRRLGVEQARVGAFVGPVATLIAALSAIAILIVGSGQLDDTTRSPGDLFAFLLYAALLTRPVGALASIYGSYQMARGTLEKLEEVLGEPIEAGYAEGRAIGRANGAIALEDVSFSYPARPPVLAGANLSIAPGEIVALTGENGVGKSTLVRLLLRFYSPDSGRITLDGSDIAQLQVQELRRQFGYVPQRALLAEGTVLENIAYGMSQPDMAAVEKATRLAQAWDFIKALPDGFDTQIGDDGVRLSGGQRQRIALARALLRDPPILILDEATSMYDLESEAAFVETCLESLEDRTVIIITHRPASLALADRIINAADLSSAAGTQSASR